MVECGQVVCMGTGCYQWIIDDFLSKVSQSYHKTLTRSVSLWGHDCLLKLSLETQRNAVQFYFKSESSSRRLRLRVGMNTGYRGKREFRSGETSSSSFIVYVWMPYSEFTERRSEILSDGKLTVFLEVTRLDTDESPDALQEKPLREEEVQDESDSDDEATVSERKVFKKLQEDFKNILDNGEDSDVTIKVNGKEFPAHSIILRARSPVFKSMFSHEMMEKLSGVVAIDDCDPGTIPDLLNYLYTGSMKHISDENVCQLYTASDKYQVAELTEECAAYMKNHLSVSNFCDILALALRYSEKELIDLSTEFFCFNAKDVAKTATWQTFLRENSTAGNELFLKYMSREK